MVVSVAASVKETAAAPTHTQSASPSEAARKAAFTTVRPPQQVTCPVLRNPLCQSMQYADLPMALIRLLFFE